MNVLVTGIAYSKKKYGEISQVTLISTVTTVLIQNTCLFSKYSTYKYFRFSDILGSTLGQGDCEEGINTLNKENSKFYKNTFNF